MYWFYSFRLRYDFCLSSFFFDLSIYKSLNFFSLSFFFILSVAWLRNTQRTTSCLNVSPPCYVCFILIIQKMSSRFSRYGFTERNHNIIFMRVGTNTVQEKRKNSERASIQMATATIAPTIKQATNGTCLALWIPIDRFSVRSQMQWWQWERELELVLFLQAYRLYVWFSLLVCTPNQCVRYLWLSFFGADAFRPVCHSLSLRLLLR